MRGVLFCTGLSSGTLSILGSILIFWSYWKIPNFRTHTKKLLLFLTIADLLNASGIMYGTIRSEIRRNETSRNETSRNCTDFSFDACVAQSFLTTSACLASFFWTFNIVFHEFLLIYRYRSCLSNKAGLVWCHFSGWVIPCMISGFALYQGVLGHNVKGGIVTWCWIRDGHTPLMDTVGWMAFTGKGWEVTTYIITFTFYILTKFIKYRRGIGKMERKPFTDLDHGKSQEIREFGLLWIFLYFYLTRIWGTINYALLVMSDQGSKNQVISNLQNILLYIQSIGDSAQAFVNCLVFCVFDKNVRTRILEILNYRRKNYEDKERLIFKNNQEPGKYGSECHQF